jgi:hypothetical protein
VEATCASPREPRALDVVAFSHSDNPGHVTRRRGSAVIGSAKGGFRRGWLVAMLAVAAVGLYSGCGGVKGPGDVASLTPLDTYVGEVDGSSTRIALITDGDRIAGFMTDGSDQAKWFATDHLDDGKAQLVARDGSPLGEVNVSDHSATGEVVAGLSRDSFDAVLASGKAGLFTAAEKTGQDSFEAGWITLPDGSALGTYDTYIDGQFQTHPAPKLEPAVKIPGFGAQVPHQQTSLFFDANVQAP